jgi:hypothetical protein
MVFEAAAAATGCGFGGFFRRRQVVVLGFFSDGGSC